jgi:hypothetical protein
LKPIASLVNADLVENNKKDDGVFQQNHNHYSLVKKSRTNKYRWALALIIGALAPVPPFVVPQKYLPNLLFIFSAFADTGHVPAITILLFGLIFWGVYSILAFGLITLVLRIGKSASGG